MHLFNFRYSLYVLGITLSLFSCGDKRREMLLGKWQLVNKKVTCTNPGQDSIEVAKRGRTMSPAEALLKQERWSRLDSLPVIFKEDGTMSQESAMNYKYQLKDSGIIVFMMNIVVSVYTINTLTKEQLIMTNGFSMKGHSHTYRKEFSKIK